MRRIITLVLLGSLLRTAQAQQPPSPAQPPAPVIITIDQARGHNYGAVCLFADLFEGYKLPALTPQFYTDPHFHSVKVTKMPAASGNIQDWKIYSYAKGGVQAGIVRRPDIAPYFYQYRLNVNELPRGWYNRQGVIDAFSIDPKHSTGDTKSLGCETYTVNFHFEQDRLRYVEVQIGMID